MTEAKSTILIVDDEPIGRAALDLLLRDHGYHLAFAANGQDALEQAQKLLPDLILLDVMMPHLNGYEVCRRIRAEPRTAEIPVLMITALDDRQARVRGIEVGADDYIAKPFDRIELRTRIKTITRLNRYRRLMTQRARFDWVVEHANDGYLILDQEGLIIYANPQARRYLGIGNMSLPIDATFFALAQKQYHCEPQQIWADWNNNGFPITSQPLFLVQPETAATQTFWLQVEAHMLPDSADQHRLLRLQNVTTTINAQRDMWKFHSMVMHKLRTPFINISSLDMLRSHAQHMNPAEIVEFAKITSDGVERLRGAIEDILQYISIPGITRRGVAGQSSQVVPLIHEIGRHLGIRDIIVHCAPESINARLALSQQALEISLRELLENAQKFHPAHDPTIEVAVGIRDQYIVIQIRDNGVMLNLEQLQNAWIPYYQGEKYFTGEVDGMGLGLAMVASLIWSVGGHCNIYNRSDETGVIVEIEIPVVTERIAAAAYEGR